MNEDKQEQVSRDEILRMTVDIVASYIAENKTSTRRIPEVINEVFDSLNSLTDVLGAPASESLNPAVPIRKSVTPDFIICLEDGKQLKMLKRHLRTAYNLTPMEYRAKWNLPSDYPMVASNYAKQRSEFAKKVGLGLKSGQKKATRAKQK